MKVARVTIDTIKFLMRRPPVRKLKEVSFKVGTGVECVTSNCMGRAVRQFEKEVRFKLGKGVENVTSNCMGRAVRQFDKEISFRLETGVGYVTIARN